MSSPVSTPQSWPAQRASELLDHLSREMRQAAKNPNAEAVHDVRVAIRRLRQCLTVFAAMFPARASKNIHKSLREVLDAAGELRNLDIAVALLQESKLNRTAPLIADLRKDRVKSAKQFVRALGKLDNGGIAAKWQAKLSASAQPPANAADMDRELPVLASEFFAAGDLAADSMAGPKRQHKFRIKTKKFRYTLELFAQLYESQLTPVQRALRNIQTRLGKMNDYAATRTLLRQYRKHHPGVVERALDFLAEKAAVEIQGFRRYWRRSMDARQKGEWVRILSATNKVAAE